MERQLDKMEATAKQAPATSKWHMTREGDVVTYWRHDKQVRVRVTNGRAAEVRSVHGTVNVSIVNGDLYIDGQKVPLD